MLASLALFTPCFCLVSLCASLGLLLDLTHLKFVFGYQSFAIIYLLKHFFLVFLCFLLIRGVFQLLFKTLGHGFLFLEIKILKKLLLDTYCF